MAVNPHPSVKIAGVVYSNPPFVQLLSSVQPYGGPTSYETYYETSDATATAADVAAGKIFYGSSGMDTGTASGGGGGSGGGLTLIYTLSLGTLSTTSTSATDTTKTLSLGSTTNYDDYDMLIVDISVNSPTNGRHTSTVSTIYLTGTSNVSTKNTIAVGSNKWNSKLGSTGTASTRQSTTAYGVYVYSASQSNGTLTVTIYYRYNSNYTGTLNGSYTARVYGIKLMDLIGG